MSQLKEYQKATEAHKRVILGDPPGTGKTRTTLHSLVSQGALDEGLYILAPRAGLYTWYNEILKWYPEYAPLLSDPISAGGSFPGAWGSGKIRISTYESFQNAWKAGYIPVPEVRAVVADEIHRKFRGRKTKKHEFFANVSPRVEFLHLLSGTLVRKGAQDLWPHLNLVAPKQFPSFWRFVTKHCVVMGGEWGGKEIFGVKNKEALRREVEPYIVYRSKKTLLPELPPKSRQALYVDLEGEQKRLYKTFIKDMVVEHREGLLMSSNSLSATTRARQLLVTPRIFGATNVLGAALPAILEHAREEWEEKHFAIFTPYVDAIEPFKQELLRAGYPDVFEFHGRMDPRQVALNERNFKERRGVALISIDFAQSFNLETCSLGYFVGSSWNPDDNEQAEDRLWRMTSLNPVNIYYLLHKDTFEESVVMSVLDQKAINSSIVLKAIHGIV